MNFSFCDVDPTQLEASLRGFPDVSVVDDFDAGSSGTTPTAAQLEAYDLVVTMSDQTYKDAVGLGNALADFVDSGGVVVEFAYDDLGGSPGFAPAGRFASGGYPAFVPGPGDNSPRTLGSFDGTSPLMQGVTSLSTSDNTDPTLAAGAKLVASWNDASLAVASKGRVVGINAWVGANSAPGVWSGDFPRLTINAVRLFKPPTLTVTKSGTGSGTVTSSPGGIHCGATCSASYSNGTTVTLTAAPASGSTFAGWTGPTCSGTGTCTVTMNAAKAVTATFNVIPLPAHVSGERDEQQVRRLRQPEAPYRRAQAPARWHDLQVHARQSRRSPVRLHPARPRPQGQRQVRRAEPPQQAQAQVHPHADPWDDQLCRPRWSELGQVLRLALQAQEA